MKTSPALDPLTGQQQGALHGCFGINSSYLLGCAVTEPKIPQQDKELSRPELKAPSYDKSL